MFREGICLFRFFSVPLHRHSNKMTYMSKMIYYNYYMKYRFLLIATCLLAFVSCHDIGQQNDIDNQAWYDSVFTQIGDDTNSTIPDYVFSTDWMQKYIRYIEKNFEHIGDDMLFSIDTAESFDCRYWTLAHVDNDTIPEILLYGGCWASGTIILTQYGGEVLASPKGCFSYINGAEGLLHSQWRHGDSYFGGLYEMKDGKFTELASYGCYTYFVDTSEVSNYGLTLDSLKCHYAGGEIGDTVVGISEIELNGKRIGSYFGYNNYVNSTGFDKVKQTLDSLYYSKGESTRFPIKYGERKIVDIIQKP